jgi:glycogen operon protein
MTLADTASYAAKHTNGENNRDGQDENFSGTAGRLAADPTPGPPPPTCGPACHLLRRADHPIDGGEFGQPAGNNNAYAQDNDITRIDWAR